VNQFFTLYGTAIAVSGAVRAAMEDKKSCTDVLTEKSLTRPKKERPRLKRKSRTPERDWKARSPESMERKSSSSFDVMSSL